jgi:hypothetical protein
MSVGGATMVRHAVKTAILVGILLLNLSCGKNDDFEAELAQCQSQCEQRMNSYECRVGGPNICFCHCELRQGKTLAVASDHELANGMGGSSNAGWSISNQIPYSGLRTPARISEANASEIASAIWSSFRIAYYVARQDNVNSGSQQVSERSFDMSVQEMAGGKRYLMEGYRLVPDGSPDNAGISIVGGRLFDPDRGYVDVSTTAPLRLDESDAWPSSGVLVATGEASSTLTLSAVSDAVYQMVLERRP